MVRTNIPRQKFVIPLTINFNTFSFFHFFTIYLSIVTLHFTFSLHFSNVRRGFPIALKISKIIKFGTFLMVYV